MQCVSSECGCARTDELRDESQVIEGGGRLRAGRHKARGAGDLTGGNEAAGATSSCRCDPIRTPPGAFPGRDPSDGRATQRRAGEPHAECDGPDQQAQLRSRRGGEHPCGQAHVDSFATADGDGRARRASGNGERGTDGAEGRESFARGAARNDGGRASEPRQPAPSEGAGAADGGAAAPRCRGDPEPLSEALVVAADDREHDGVQGAEGAAGPDGCRGYVERRSRLAAACGLQPSEGR